MIEITTTFRGVPVSVRARIVLVETTAADQAEFPDSMTATIEGIEMAVHDDDDDAEMLVDIEPDGPEMLALVQELLTAYVRRGGDA